jgi:adenosylcobinamide-GDP ribazoletransferase
LTASAALLAVAIVAQPAAGGHDWTVTIALVLAIVLGLLLAGVVCGHAVRRLGGVTGDVFGALVEITTTAVLVVAAIGATWA